MDEEIKKELDQEELSEFHKALLSHCKALVSSSRNKMQRYYRRWDAYDQVYNGERTPDVQDQKAADRKEPIKMVVPTTYTQVQTFIAFCFSMFYQKEHLFEVTGVGPEDMEPAKKAEAVVDRDLVYNTFDGKLYQFLLDVGKYGLGVMKTAWHKETQWTTENIEVPTNSLFGTAAPQLVTQEVEKTKFLGTKIINVSPYRFFPDVRVPMSRFQEGEFIASEDEFTITQLQQMEDVGEITGVKKIKPMEGKSLEERGQTRFPTMRGNGGDPLSVTGKNQSFPVIVTEVQVVIDPRKFQIEGKPMDKEGKVKKWNVWIANDQRILKAEPLGYLHDQFTYDVGEYTPDMHRVCNPGLAETIHALQDVITWFINARITSVRKTINNWLVVDPLGVEMDDLANRSPVIRLKEGVSGQGVDRWIKQLTVQDVTQRHLEDVDSLQKIVQMVTGINETALGQFASGRRSASEAKNVASAAAARLKVVARMLFNGTLVPMAQKMISNSRQGLDEAMMVKITGEGPTDQFLPVDKTQLVGNYDFEIFDGTLPTDRQYQAEVLKEVLMLVLGNPAAAQMLQYNPRLLMDEILELRGIRNADRFHLPPPNVVQGMGGIQPGGTGPAVDGNGGSPGIQDVIAALSQGGGDGQVVSPQFGT